MIPRRALIALLVALLYSSTAAQETTEPPTPDTAPDVATPAPDTAPDTAAPTPDTALAPDPAPDTAPDATTPATVGAPTPTPPPQPKTAEGERMVTWRAQVSIRSFTPDETTAEAVAALEALGAYIQSSSTGRVELRVPASKLDAAFEALRGVGEVVDARRSSEDVGLEVVQLRAKIGEVEKSRARVLEMLTLSDNVKDSLLIEQQLQTITSALEQHQGRLRFLERRLREAPLTLSVSMKARPRVERLPAHRRPHSWVQSYGIGSLLP